MKIEHGKDKGDEEEVREVSETRVGVDSSAFQHLWAYQHSMSTFSGVDNVTVRIWLLDFEEMRDLCDWIDAQCVVYPKRLLRAAAKLFFHYERYRKSWNEVVAESKQLRISVPMRNGKNARMKSEIPS